jgi:hypothetical protein
MKTDNHRLIADALDEPLDLGVFQALSTLIRGVVPTILSSSR